LEVLFGQMASSETVSITMDFLEESAAIPELLRL
jgi:hypothetical protein